MYSDHTQDDSNQIWIKQDIDLELRSRLTDTYIRLTNCNAFFTDAFLMDVQDISDLSVLTNFLLKESSHVTALKERRKKNF